MDYLQLFLCGVLSTSAIVGIIVSLIGVYKHNENPNGLKWIVTGTLVVAASSFFLTLVAKIFAEL